MNGLPGPDLAGRIKEIIRASDARSRKYLPVPASTLIGASVIALVLLYLIWLQGSGDGAVSYVSEPAARGNLTVVVTATGSVQPTNKVDVSSELSGTVRKVLVDYNSPVKVGDVLAELDTDKLNATVEASRAKLAAAKARVIDTEATLVEKRLDFDRKGELVARDAISARDLEIAKAAYERALAAVASAEADRGAAEAELKLNETNLAKACICSPINGVVLERNVDPGQIVASSFQAPILFSIAEDLRKMEIQVDVDEADVGNVKEGQSATFSVDAYPDRKFPATIREVRYASEVVQGVVTYKAVLAIDNSQLLLRPGMTATAEIVVRRVDAALLVPNAALRFSPPNASDSDEEVSLLRRILPGPPRFRPPTRPEEAGSRRTLWVLRDGAPAPEQVEIGATDGKRTEVRTGGIKEGDEVIVDSATTKS